jgi:hypothetical protein
MHVAYPVAAILHKTGVLSAIASLSRPAALSVIGSFVLQVARKPLPPMVLGTATTVHQDNHRA